MLDLSNLKTFDVALERLERSRAYYAKGASAQMARLKPDIQTKFINPMLQELGYEPGDSPLGNFAKYATPRQKRYYWWAVRQGLIPTDANGRYIRSHELSGGWETEVDLKVGSRARLTLRTRNKKRYSIFVVGHISLGRTRPSQAAYTQPIQKFHTYTGWLPAAPTIQKWYKKAEDFARQQLREWFEQGLP